MLLSKYSFISKLVTCLVLSKSNLFWTNIFFKYGKCSDFIRLIKYLINLKLSWLVISTKNKAHWHSYKKVSINDGSLRNSSSILTSYMFKSTVFDSSNSADILLVMMAILNILYNYL